MRKYELGGDYKVVFFIGIGGIHMSGLAQLLAQAGYKVRGSDQKRSKITDKLEKCGIPIYIGHSSDHITDDIDIVVFTAAVPSENPELIAAKQLNITTMSRAEILGLVMKNYKYAICVSGTHGKTTTTSMITEIFMDSEKNPTSIIGGILPSIGGALRIGGMDFFIAESCEYYDSFLSFFPFVGIILNIELDHIDYFGTIERLRKSFYEFAKRIPENGVLVIYGGIENLQEITSGLLCDIITYGTEDSDWQARNIVFDEKGFASFDTYYKNIFFSHIKLSVPGKHNILNSLASIASSVYLSQMGYVDLPTLDIRNGILKYSGTNRRFQYKGICNGVSIYDDYSHHPTEIIATIEAALNMSYNRLWCVFQPHTKKRTKELLNELAESFNKADYVVLLDIYSPVGREEFDCEIHSIDLFNIMKRNGIKVFYFSTNDEAEEFILKNSIPNDMLITMGAGDVVLLGESILSVS